MNNKHSNTLAVRPSATPIPTTLADLESGLIVASNAFERWMVRCMAAAGEADLTPMEVSLLQHVNHRGSKKKLADICFVHNMEDTHVVSYALRKLVKMGYVQSEKIGKESVFSTTTAGQSLCSHYQEIREQCLLDALSESGIDQIGLRECSQFLRVLSGLYEQAARRSAAL